jgi:sialic acid synthase SpsE
MPKIILDISANTHKNNWPYLKKMLDELKKIDTGKHEVIIKHQLFTKVGENIPLDHEIFKKAYNYAAELGYKTTSSVFDLESLGFLLQFDVPMIKIANNRSLDWIVGEIPRKIPVYVSVKQDEAHYDDNICYLDGYGMIDQNMTVLGCVSKYPAKVEDYYGLVFEHAGISDHTVNWDFFNYWQERLKNLYDGDKERMIASNKGLTWEVHYKLFDSTGLDAGEFARTPEQLAEIL